MTAQIDADTPTVYRLCRLAGRWVEMEKTDHNPKLRPQPKMECHPAGVATPRH
jgi:hypothetical protein